MSNNYVKTDECSNCGSRIVIYKGWITFKEDRIVIPNSKWRCPNCGKTGKLDNWKKK